MSGRKKGASGYSHDEMEHFLDLLEKVKPNSKSGWERVAQSHSAKYPSRTLRALKNKYSAMTNINMPTGDPRMPWDVKRAKRLQTKIRAKCNITCGSDKFRLVKKEKKSKSPPKQIAVAVASKDNGTQEEEEAAVLPPIQLDSPASGEFHPNPEELDILASDDESEDERIESIPMIEPTSDLTSKRSYYTQEQQDDDFMEKLAGVMEKNNERADAKHREALDLMMQSSDKKFTMALQAIVQTASANTQALLQALKDK